MKQLFQENRNAFLLLLVLLFVLAFTVYFFFYLPIAEDLQQAESEEQDLQEAVAEMKAAEEQLETERGKGNREAEKQMQEQKLAPAPELESFLLTLNEIEQVSNSRINAMAFGYDGEVPIQGEAAEEEQEDDADTGTEEQGEDASAVTEEGAIPETEGQEEVETEEELETAEALEESMGDVSGGQESPIEMTDMPAGLHSIAVTLEVNAPDYEHFQLLMQEIEKQQRMMFVTNLAFEKPAESELVIEDTGETITATMDIMTFYYKGEE